MALGAFAASPAPAPTPARIPIVDVRHHLAPPAYIATLKKSSSGERVTAEWTPEKSLADMDGAGVATAMLSITAPGVWFGNDQGAVPLARLCNEWNAKLAADSHGRFGAFASLPLRNVDGSLAKLNMRSIRSNAKASRQILCAGDGLTQSAQGRGLYLSARAGLLPQLDCRSTVIGHRVWYRHHAHDREPLHHPASRCPDIKFIFSHAGGTLPFLIERFIRLPRANKTAAAKTPEGVIPLLQRFYYDTTQVANPAAMGALTKVVPTTHVLFGTDFPFRTSADHVNGLKEIYAEADLHKIESDNARALLPWLKAT